MKKAAGRLLVWSISVVSLLALTGCEGGLFGTKKVMLWNGKDFTGWKLYLPDDTVSVDDVWSVKDGVIHCVGKPNGYMRTTSTFEDYRLHLEWRWPETPTNSGVLLHASGPDQVWPKCIECQLKSGNAGDFVLIGGPGITVDGEDKQNVEKQFVVAAKKEQSSENPAGEWNTYEIYCLKDTIRCYVNGVLQNEGNNATETAGWICLQSEGSPIEFRNIYIKPLH
jgi:hypothetical protein